MPADDTRSRISPVQERRAPTPGGLSIALVLAPLAWFVHLWLASLLSPIACRAGSTRILLLVSAGALVVAAAGGLLSWRSWRALRARRGGRARACMARSRFVSLLGLMLNAFFVLVILAQSLPVFILTPCG